ncbi:EI24 domain-containing protein [bacterium]|nr:EI24 domain-containing protein [bacterium]
MNKLVKQGGSFFQGISSAYLVLPFLKNNKKNIVYIVVPFVINILVSIVSLWFSFSFLADFYPIVIPSFSFSWAFLSSIFSMLFNFLIHLSLLLSSYVIGFSIVCSSFYGWMVEKIERSLGLESSMQSLSIFQQIRDSVVISSVLVLISFMSIVISFFPIIGPLCTVFIGLPLQALVLGIEFSDFSQSLRGMSVREKVAFTKSHMGGVFACGLISLCFLPFPIINSCLFTISILGATFHLRKVEFQKLLEKTYPNEFKHLKLLSKANESLKWMQADDLNQSYLECIHSETKEVYCFNASGHINKIIESTK